MYIELTGGRQRGLSLVAEDGKQMPSVSYQVSASRVPRFVMPSAAEIAAHAAFVERLKGAVWLS